MNILIFVMTMLMLLSLMTYARLESYRDSQALQKVFKHYMEREERGYINLRAGKVYEKIKVTEKKKEEEGEGKSTSDKPPPKTAINASSRIGIKPLLDSNRDKNEKEWLQTQLLLKKLMRILYEKHPFYQDLEKERPFFLDELIREITRTIDDLPKDKKPKTAKDLANLKLADPYLDDILYKMLNGALYDTQMQAKKAEKSEAPEEPSVESGSDNGESTNGADEYKSIEGYYSLLDFVTDRSGPKIRVFLAPREVLQTAFQDLNTVDSIIEERQRLHDKAKQGDDVNELKEIFKNQFERMKDPNVEEDSLNFSVSKTNPKYYNK